MAIKSKFSWYVARRLLQTIPVLLVVLSIVFIFCRLAPGDPIYFIGGPEISEEYYNTLKAELGLDKPIVVQYLIYMRNAVRGDFGYSTIFQERVTKIVLERLVNTLMLTFSALFFAAIVGVTLGVLSSRKHYSFTDNIISVGSLVGYSQPQFWTAMILILLFSGSGVPIQGMTSIGKELSRFGYFLDFLSHLFLPALTLTIYQVALFSRLTRSSMLEILLLDFIATARSKGLTEKRILIKHSLRNALIPIVTLFGVQIGFMFSGAALVEIVFSWPGVGSLMLDAVLARDYPLLSGIFILVSLTVILVNLVTDIVYGKLDPRIIYS